MLAKLPVEIRHASGIPAVEAPADTHRVVSSVHPNTSVAARTWVERIADGVADGRQIHFTRLGSPLRTGIVLDGQPTGVWHEFGDDGALEIVRVFDGERVEVEHWSGSRVWLAGSARRSADGLWVRDGVWREEESSVVYERTYVDGREVDVAPDGKAFERELASDVNATIERYGVAGSVVSLVRGHGSPTPDIVLALATYASRSLPDAQRLGASGLATLLAPIATPTLAQIVAHRGQFRGAYGDAVFGWLIATLVPMANAELPAEADDALRESLAVHGAAHADALIAVVGPERAARWVVRNGASSSLRVLWKAAPHVPAIATLDAILDTLTQSSRGVLGSVLGTVEASLGGVLAALVARGVSPIDRTVAWLGRVGKAPYRAVGVRAVATQLAPRTTGVDATHLAEALLGLADDSLDEVTTAVRDGLIALGEDARPALVGAEKSKKSKIRALAADVVAKLAPAESSESAASAFGEATSGSDGSAKPATRTEKAKAPESASSETTSTGTAKDPTVTSASNVDALHAQLGAKSAKRKKALVAPKLALRWASQETLDDASSRGFFAALTELADAPPEPLVVDTLAALDATSRAELAEALAAFAPAKPEAWMVRARIVAGDDGHIETLAAGLQGWASGGLHVLAGHALAALGRRADAAAVRALAHCAEQGHGTVQTKARGELERLASTRGVAPEALVDGAMPAEVDDARRASIEAWIARRLEGAMIEGRPLDPARATAWMLGSELVRSVARGLLLLDEAGHAFAVDGADWLALEAAESPKGMLHIAHPTELEDARIEALSEALAARGLVPRVPQLTRPFSREPETAARVFVGTPITTAKLLAWLTSHGFRRGPAGEAGLVDSGLRPLGLGWVFVIHHDAVPSSSAKGFEKNALRGASARAVGGGARTANLAMRSEALELLRSAAAVA